MKRALAETRAGLNTGILSAVQSLTHGLIAFAPLGAAGVGYGMSAALAASAAAGFWTAVRGSSRPLIGTTTAATALVSAALLTSQGPLGMGEAVLLAMMLAAIGGLLMLALAAGGLGRLAALIPAPVIIGLGNSTVLLILISQAPLMLGLAPGAGWGGLDAPTALASLAVASLALILMLRPLPGVPAPLSALVAAAILHHVLAASGMASGPLVGTAPSPAILFEGIMAAFGSWPGRLPLGTLAAAASSLALLATLEVLTACAALRQISGRRAEGQRDISASALGMLSGAALGGAPAACLGSASLACWRWGGRGRAAMLLRAAVTAAVLLLAGPAIAALPFAALAGVLVGAVLPLFEAQPLLVTSGPGRARRAADAGVILAVMASAVMFGLVAAVGIGVLLSVMIFTAAMSSSAIRRSTRNPIGRSRVRRLGEDERLLRAAGERVALVELEGPVFFGSAEGVVSHAEKLRADGVTILIFDLSRVTRIDISGGKRLIEAMTASTGRVMLTPLHPGSRAWEELAALGLLNGIAASARFSDLASAVEEAEAMLLADEKSGAPYALGGLEALEAFGLPASAAATVLPCLTEQRFAAGSTILRQGDAADAAYLLLEGQVLISLPAAPGRPATRLAVLSPLVVFGESALLGAARRNADAIARTEVLCLRLGAAEMDVLREQSPAIAWQMMAGIARQLAAHVTAANATIDRLEA